jgi:hypothetical protein
MSIPNIMHPDTNNIETKCGYLSPDTYVMLANLEADQKSDAAKFDLTDNTKVFGQCQHDSMLWACQPFEFDMSETNALILVGYELNHWQRRFGIAVDKKHDNVPQVKNKYENVKRKVGSCGASYGIPPCIRKSEEMMATMDRCIPQFMMAVGDIHAEETSHFSHEAAALQAQELYKKTNLLVEEGNGEPEITGKGQRAQDLKTKLNAKPVAPAAGIASKAPAKATPRPAKKSGRKRTAPAQPTGKENKAQATDGQSKARQAATKGLAARSKRVSKRVGSCANANLNVNELFADMLGDEFQDDDRLDAQSESDTNSDQQDESPPDVTPTDDTELSEYEIRRAKRVQANKQKMKDMGLTRGQRAQQRAKHQRSCDTEGPEQVAAGDGLGAGAVTPSGQKKQRKAASSGTKEPATHLKSRRDELISRCHREEGISGKLSAMADMVNTPDIDNVSARPFTIGELEISLPGAMLFHKSTA